jgi:hypothetical protein
MKCSAVSNRENHTILERNSSNEETLMDGWCSVIQLRDNKTLEIVGNDRNYDKVLRPLLLGSMLKAFLLGSMLKAFLLGSMLKAAKLNTTA